MNHIKIINYLLKKYNYLITDKEEFIALIKINIIMNINISEIINNVNDYFNNYEYNEYLINEKNYLLFEIDNKKRKRNKRKEYNFAIAKKVRKKSLF